ncbi:MAG: nitric oxide reductase transcriptional regulator NorR [Deltaproteobacteria bacterium]|nr:nitric oxide reductase transcriptional regulator NorR [Deltaproteobacteria bacterium]
MQSSKEAVRLRAIPKTGAAPIDRKGVERALLSIATDLTAALANDGRYERLIQALCRVFPCDAATLLRLEADSLIPVATSGLVSSVGQTRYYIDQHPRLAAILASATPVRFAADDARPDPFDGAIASGEQLDVHSCMGCALKVQGKTVGALTLDALEPHCFDPISDDEISTFAALAGAAMQTADLLSKLEQEVGHRTEVAHALLQDNLDRGRAVLLGDSDAMQRLRDEIAMVARSDVTVLIAGETGVGKELVARLLHEQSERSAEPLVYVNCAALPESLAESELFGHLRGSFTGASRDRRGKFELANKGTLLLDEIGEMPLSVQGILLRVLQDGDIQRVGSDQQIKVDVRVLAATNRNLAQEVERGNFRADLFHRLTVYPISVPPLRDRRQDVDKLVVHFADIARRRIGARSLRLNESAFAVFGKHDWPGNVRELEHAVLRAVLRASAGKRNGLVVVAEEHCDVFLPSAEQPPALPQVQPEVQPLHQATDDFQRHLIRCAVDSSEGNWAEAARKLQVDRSNLHRMAQRLGLK